MTTYTHSTADVRRALFAAIDDGDPERGGDAWVTDAATVKAFYRTLSDLEAEEAANESTWRLVEEVTGKLIEEAQDRINGKGERG